MPKKLRLSKDAFDWIQDTSNQKNTAQPDQPKAAPSKTQSKAKKKVPAAPSKENAEVRSVMIRYHVKGAIIAIIEMLEHEQFSAKHPGFDVPADEKVAVFNLTGELFEMDLLDIHSDYRVDTAGKKPELVQKKGGG